ncbi:recombination protein RecR [Moorella sp. E308F]|jgi:recombination protein RecR|uniref:recombination mediator RecR n=1 Tax=unclassified Neomoorella TaxID=2676739 RepID=UPI0010FFB7DB|nr:MULTISPECIES: recombination mediator RecR [unclassified Moorella (in: firmicutes)]GEA14492.1 recombination protein RecR [Moorella sp. E308F]GEA18136.1 recombination protein RecR [Moorella sp. E306M]
MNYPEPLNKLIAALGKLPGVGPKTAQRLAFYLLNAPAAEAENLAAAILEARRKIHYCSICGNLTDRDPCLLCTDPERDHTIICVVEEARDIVALEKTRQYRGLYHVLQGAISPVDGIGPDQLKVKELLRRLQGGKVKEVVLATNADVEGEATALYLARLLKPLAVRVTRLAYGLPVGSDLEYADEITLARAFSGRHEME